MSYKITKLETIRHPDMPSPIVRGILVYEDGSSKYFNMTYDPPLPSEDEMRAIIDKKLAEQVE